MDNSLHSEPFHIVVTWNAISDDEGNEIITPTIYSFKVMANLEWRDFQIKPNSVDKFRDDVVQKIKKWCEEQDAKDFSSFMSSLLSHAAGRRNEVDRNQQKNYKQKVVHSAASILLHNQMHNKNSNDDACRVKTNVLIELVRNI